MPDDALLDLIRRSRREADRMSRLVETARRIERMHVASFFPGENARHLAVKAELHALAEDARQERNRLMAEIAAWPARRADTIERRMEEHEAAFEEARRKIRLGARGDVKGRFKL